MKKPRVVGSLQRIANPETITSCNNPSEFTFMFLPIGVSFTCSRGSVVKICCHFKIGCASSEKREGIEASPISTRGRVLDL